MVDKGTNGYNSLAPWHFFTQQVHNILELAYLETKDLGHREIGTIQLLLGLIRQEKGLGAQVLRDAGVKLENARLEVEKIQGRGAGSGKNIPYNQHTKQVFELSRTEAEQLQDSEIDTQHLLLGLLRQSQGAAIIVLQNLGVSSAQLRNQVFRRLVKQGHPTASQFLPVPSSVNSNRTNINLAYLSLIGKILKYPEGSEAECLKDNPGIIPPEFIETMALILEQQGDAIGPKVLRGLIALGTEKIVDQPETSPVNLPKSVPTSTPPEEKVTKPESLVLLPPPEDFEPAFIIPEVQAIEPDLMELILPPKDLEPVLDVPTPSNQDLMKFLYQLLRVSFESKDDKQVVYNFLRENLDKLSDRFPEVLQNWSNETLPKVGDAKKQEFLKRLTFICSLIRKFDGGVRETNLEIALKGYNIIASIVTTAETPEDLATIQNCLGLTYLERVQGRPGENLKKAIDYFNLALNFYKKERFPDQRKIILQNAKKATIKLKNILSQDADGSKQKQKKG